MTGYAYLSVSLTSAVMVAVPAPLMVTFPSESIWPAGAGRCVQHPRRLCEAGCARHGTALSTASRNLHCQWKEDGGEMRRSPEENRASTPEFLVFLNESSIFC